MANLNDFTKKNPIFTGNTGIRIPVGTSADRDETANNAATFRYNQDIGGVEFYGPTGWVPLAAPPSISTVTPDTFNGESGTEFTINGANFTADAQVYFVTANSTDLLATTVTYVGPGQLRATTPRDILVSEEPLDIRVVQSSGTVTKLDVIDAGGLPVWVTTAGTLGSVFGANTVNVYVSATDPEESAVTYTINSGSLPNGLALTTANGLIQGLANSVLANTTFNFTIRASDTVNNNTDRTFSYTILNRAPVINTAAGSLGTFYSGNAVPSTTIDAYDPDNGQVQFNLTSGSLPANTELALSTGTISGTPIVVNANTTYTFEVTANDEGSLTASNTYSFTVLNRFPVWNTAAGSLADIDDDEIDSYTPITVNAYDPDGEVVTYQLTQGSVPAGLTFVSANAAIAGVPETVESNTTSTFTVTASDGSNETSREFTMTVRLPLDPYFKETVLLLHGDGSANSNNNLGFADSSDNNFPITVNGDAYESNFGPYAVPDGNWSNYFDGNGDYLSIADNAALQMRDGNFTIEFWLRNESSSGSPVFFRKGGYNGAANGIELYSDGVGQVLKLLYGYGTSGTWDTINTTNTTTWSDGNWHHIAIVRNSGTLTVYYDGVDRGSATVTLDFTSNESLLIGARAGNSYFTGYISNFRMVKGTAVYTSGFTSPTTSLTAISGTSILTCQSNRLKDNSTNNFTITKNGDVKVQVFNPFGVLPDGVNGSGYFDGTGDYLIVPSNSAFAFGTEDFTVEMWIYAPSSISNALLWGTHEVGVGSGWYLSISSNLLNWGSYGNGSNGDRATSNSVPLGSWSHIAVSKENGTLRLFINGVQGYSASDTSNYTSIPYNFTIGSDQNGDEGLFTGFISNLRVVKGTALYTSDFTPPSSPLTAVTNTQLLTCQYAGSVRNVSFLDSGPIAHRITRNGNATQGTFSPFSKPEGAWSNYFDGSGDYFTFTGNSSTNFSGADWCVETWFYMTKAPSTLSPIFNSTTGTNNWVPYLGISIRSDYTISAFVNATDARSTQTVSLNRWHHIAMVRSGGVVKVYLDGEATSISTTSDINNSNLSFWIGYIGPPAGVTEQFGGYFSNMRMVKGSAVYTTGFTPSTTPLTAITNTVLLTCQSNRFVDNSTNNFTLTRSGDTKVTPFSPFRNTNAYLPTVNGGSAYFDGSGDYLIKTGSDILRGDFTIEYWMYPPSVGNYPTSFSTFNAVGVAASMYAQFGLNTTSFNFQCGNGSGDGTIGTYAATLNAWQHHAIVRSGTTVTAYVNGVSVGTRTSSVQFDFSSLGIGGYTGSSAGSYPFVGYISNFRIINGTNLYPSSFTPPTAPVTAIANTSLLCNFTNAGIYDSTGLNVLETIGNSQVDTSIKKYGTGAMKFDGSGDAIKLQTTSDLEMGSGDFTWEFWINPNSTSSSPIIMTQTAQDINIQFNNSGQLIVYDGTDRVMGSISTGTWTHFALVRSSGSLRGYINGIAVGSAWTNTSATEFTMSGGYIGARANLSQPFNGYIDELRITKGIARYTSNFTPRSRAFPNV